MGEPAFAVTREGGDVVVRVLVELFHHKERIVALSHLSGDEVVSTYSILLRHLALVREEVIAEEHWLAAGALCEGLDVTDMPHVALTFAINGRLWTGDKRLKEGLLKKGFVIPTSG